MLCDFTILYHDLLFHTVDYPPSCSSSEESEDFDDLNHQPVPELSK